MDVVRWWSSSFLWVWGETVCLVERWLRVVGLTNGVVVAGQLSVWTCLTSWGRWSSCGIMWLVCWLELAQRHRGRHHGQGPPLCHPASVPGQGWVYDRRQTGRWGPPWAAMGDQPSSGVVGAGIYWRCSTYNGPATTSRDFPSSPLWLGMGGLLVEGVVPGIWGSHKWGVKQDDGVGGVGVSEDMTLALVGLTASPMVGNLLEVMLRATQACFDRNNRSNESVKYTICRVSSFRPDGEVPEMRRTKAPAMSMLWLLVAVISMVTVVRCFLCSLSLDRSFMPARQNWQPLSAMAG